MIDFETAVRLVAQHITPLPSEEVEVTACAGRALAAPIVAPHDLPPRTTSAMDGYAVRAADVAHAAPSAPVKLTLSGTAAAGHSCAARVAPGTCIAIMTGAELPPGADAVVKIEDTRRSGATIEIFHAVPRGAHVRPCGAEARAGQVLVAAHQPVMPAAMGLAIACGYTHLNVHRRPRVTCLLTGDEIAPPGAPLGEGQIHDTVGPALRAALTFDGCEEISCSYVEDDLQALQSHIAAAISRTDVLLIVGGASMGAYDYAQDALAASGAKEIFRKVAIKPGKPLAYAICGSTHIFNLPGNPVSALVCYYLFVRFALRLLQGYAHEAAGLRTCEAVLEEALQNPEARLEFVRGVASTDGRSSRVRPLPARDSAMLSGLANANALIMCPPHARLAPPSPVRVLLLPV